MLLSSSKRKTPWTAVGLLVLFLCICFLRVDVCLGKDQTEKGAEGSTKSETQHVVPNIRANRFPSVTERVKLYMSNWYNPPCEDDVDAFVGYWFDKSASSGSKNKKKKKKKKKKEDWPTLRVDAYENHPIVNQTTRVMTNIKSIIEPDMLFFMDEDTLLNCADWDYDEEEAKENEDPFLDRVIFRHNMRIYCEDVQKLLLPAWRHLRFLEKKKSSKEKAETSSPPPVLLQFGDNKQSHDFKDVNIPHIKKFRSAATQPEDLSEVTSGACHSSSGSNIRKALNSAHGQTRFQPIVWKLASDRHFKKLYDVYRYDTQWKNKKPMAVFRGQLTGSRDGYDKHMSDEENCHNMKRCRLVYNHANSTLIHARLTSTRGRLPDVLNGVELLANKTKIDDLLEYKGIIMIEGNDVASGLKWALLSQSVVLMPKPKHTSWCMEELLEPWVHYIPIDDFATNVEERMQWIIDNDELAQEISERATLWMEDMVFHPDAAQDDREIQEEILRRYEAHFMEMEEVVEVRSE